MSYELSGWLVDMGCPTNSVGLGGWHGRCCECQTRPWLAQHNDNLIAAQAEGAAMAQLLECSPAQSSHVLKSLFKAVYLSHVPDTQLHSAYTGYQEACWKVKVASPTQTSSPVER